MNPGFTGFDAVHVVHLKEATSSSLDFATADSARPVCVIEPHMVAEARWNLPGELNIDSALVHGWPPNGSAGLVRGRAAMRARASACRSPIRAKTCPIPSDWMLEVRRKLPPMPQAGSSPLTVLP
jgi:hypothetical protein